MKRVAHSSRAIGAAGEEAGGLVAFALVSTTHNIDAIVIGAGLAGLVATAELTDAGRRVILLEQEPEVSLGGQAFWSFGGPVPRGQPRAAPDGDSRLA